MAGLMADWLDLTSVLLPVFCVPVSWLCSSLGTRFLSTRRHPIRVFVLNPRHSEEIRKLRGHQVYHTDVRTSW